MGDEGGRWNDALGEGGFLRGGVSMVLRVGVVEEGGGKSKAEKLL